MLFYLSNAGCLAYDAVFMFEQAFKNIDDVLWKEAGRTTELDYTEQTSWLLFLKYLDGLEQDRAMEAKLEGKKYS
jgi:type I restriction enzyme M protein